MTVLTLHVNHVLINVLGFFLQICVELIQYCIDVVAVVEINSIQFMVHTACSAFPFD